MDIDAVITGILQREGSTFTDDAQDLPTKYGVTLPALKEFNAAATIADLQALDEAGARAFYRWRFKLFIGLQVSERIWRNLLDAVTLHGPTGAIRAAQTALNVTVDGQLGPATIAALGAAPVEAFCLAFVDARVSICAADIQRDVTQRYGVDAVTFTDLKYLHGWMRRIIQVGFACLVLASLQACASVAPRPPAQLQAVMPTPLLLGINDGFHGPVPPDIVTHYCGWNRDLVVRAPVLSADGAAVFLASLQACPRLHGLLLVEKNDLALVKALAAFIQTAAQPPPTIWGVELGNELDLAGLTPPQFAAFIGTGRQTLRAAGYVGNIIIGGIYTVDDHSPQDFEEYLKPAIAACPDCLIGLHWYGDTSAYWLARVQALGAPAAVTEFGIPACTPAQEAAQLAYFKEKLTAYARTGNILVAIAYQRPSAPAPCDNSDASHLAHYGFQRPPPDDSWKLVDSFFAEQP